MLFRDMGVSLGCDNRGMSQKLLDNTHISSIAKKKCGHSVAQHVRRDIALDSRCLLRYPNHVRNSLS